jgi:PKD repeat protein
MKRSHAAVASLLASLMVGLLLLPACIPGMSCDSSAEPTPRPTGPVRADFYASETQQSGKGRISFFSSSAGPVKEWLWDFTGDGVIDSTGPETYWYFNENGYYTITLNIEGWDGSTDSMVKTDYIYIYGCST